MTMPGHIYSIGHSNHSLETFLGLLKTSKITAIADVRSVPYSQYVPHFTKEPLQKSLKSAGIHYVYMGAELGGRSADPSCFEQGRVKYDRIAQTDGFQSGITRLETGSKTETVAIMCSEKDPLDCHRTLLVVMSLVDRGLEVDHILADGSVESHENTMQRLLSTSGLSETDLFTTPQERLVMALREQEKKIAYFDESLLK